MKKKLTETQIQAFTLRYMNSHGDLDALCKAYNLTRMEAHWYLQTPAAKELLGEAGFIDDQFFAFTHREMSDLFHHTMMQLLGREPVPTFTTDRDGNVQQHMVYKFHDASARAMLVDMAKIMGIVKPETVNLRQTLTLDMTGIDEDIVEFEEVPSLPVPEAKH